MDCCFSVGVKNFFEIDNLLIKEEMVKSKSIQDGDLEEENAKSYKIIRNNYDKVFEYVVISDVRISDVINRDLPRLGRLIINDELIKIENVDKFFNKIGHVVRSDKALTSLLSVMYQAIDGIFMSSFQANLGLDFGKYVSQQKKIDNMSCREIRINCDEKILSLSRRIVFSILDSGDDMQEKFLYDVSWNISGKLCDWEECRVNNLKIKSFYLKTDQEKLENNKWWVDVIL